MGPLLTLAGDCAIFCKTAPWKDQNVVDLSRTRMNVSFNVRKVGATDLGPIHRAVDIVPDVKHVFVCMPYEGIHVIDVADPRRPWVIDNWGWWQEGWFPIRMKIVGTYAYVVGSVPRQSPGLRILDISRPTHPRELGYCKGDGVGGWEPFHWDIAIAGTLAYMIFDGNLVWVVDVSNPRAPEEVSDILMEAPTTAIQIRGDLAYVVAHGLHVMDLRDPVAPIIVGYCNTTARSQVKSSSSFPGEDPMCRPLVVGRDRAYVSDTQGGYRILDLSHPQKPSPIGWLHPPTDMRDVDFAVNGDFAFMLEIGSRGHVRVLDMGDPLDPVTTGYRDIPYPCHCLALSGEHLYVAGFTHFGIYDCSAAMQKTS